MPTSDRHQGYATQPDRCHGHPKDGGGGGRGLRPSVYLDGPAHSSTPPTGPPGPGNATSGHFTATRTF